jgi:hypothetical protein
VSGALLEKMTPVTDDSVLRFGNNRGMFYMATVDGVLSKMEVISHEIAGQFAGHRELEELYEGHC